MLLRVLVYITVFATSGYTYIHPEVAKTVAVYPVSTMRGTCLYPGVVGPSTTLPLQA